MKYKPINGWTKNKILQVFRKRRYNCAAVDMAGCCVYLTENGNKCAVGMFIPPGHAGQEYEGPVDGLLEKFPDLKEKMPLTNVGMTKLQNVHDDQNSRKNAKQKMIEWVKKYVKG